MKKVIYNKDIRELAKNNNVFMWEIAKKINLSEFTLSRHMRDEMTNEEKEQMYLAIYEIVQEREKAES